MLRWAATGINFYSVRRWSMEAALWHPVMRRIAKFRIN